MKILVVDEYVAKTSVIPHDLHIFCDGAHLVDYVGYNLAFSRQRLHPTRHIDVKHTQRELQKHAFQKFAHVLSSHLLNVFEHYGYAVFVGKRVSQSYRLAVLRMLGIEKQYKRLVKFFHLSDNSLFCAEVALSRQIKYRAVGRYQHAYRRMVGDDLACAVFSRLRKRHFFVAPRSIHQSVGIPFFKTLRALKRITDAIHKPELCSAARRKFYVNASVRHKLRLGRHNSLAVRRLRQFVDYALLVIIVLQIRQDHRLHKFCNKSRLSASHRSNDSDINISFRACCNILIKVKFFHILLQFLVR